MKTFGDMGQTACLWLIRDRFIAGHSSCELRRYLDSVPPETPIRDVVDRCRVWESHADPEIRRISKPSPDPIYPAYVVGDSDNVGETIRVAAVTKPNTIAGEHGCPGSGPSTGSRDADGGKIAAASGGGDTESPDGARESTQARGVGKLVHIVPLGTADIGTADSAETHQTGLEWHRMFFMRKVGRDSLPTLDESFPFMLPGWRAESTLGGFIMISPVWRGSVVERKIATVVMFDPRGTPGAPTIAAPTGGDGY